MSWVCVCVCVDIPAWIYYYHRVIDDELGLCVCVCVDIPAWIYHYHRVIDDELGLCVCVDIPAWIYYYHRVTDDELGLCVCRYPSVVDDSTMPYIREWLSTDPAGQGHSQLSYQIVELLISWISVRSTSLQTVVMHLTFDNTKQYICDRHYCQLHTAHQLSKLVQ